MVHTFQPLVLCHYNTAALIEKRFTMHGPNDAKSITFDTKAAFRNTRDSISFRDVMFVSLHLSLNIDL